MGAQADLEAVLEDHPKDVEAHGALGMLLLPRDAAAARPHLVAAADARPHDGSLAVAAAAAEASAGDPEAAVERLEEAVERHPYDVRIHLALGRILTEHGDARAAYDVLAEAVMRVPDARVVLALVEVARDSARLTEAAVLLDSLAERTGNPTFVEAAKKLREHRPE